MIVSRKVLTIFLTGHPLMAGDNLIEKIKLLTGSLDVVVEKSFLCTYACLLLRYGNTGYNIFNAKIKKKQLVSILKSKNEKPKLREVIFLLIT